MQATPTSSSTTNKGTLAHETPIDPWQTIGQPRRALGSSDFGNKSCRRNKHILHWLCPAWSPTFLQGIVAAKSLDHSTTLTSPLYNRKLQGQTQRNVEQSTKGRHVTILLLPPSALSHECQRQWIRGHCHNTRATKSPHHWSLRRSCSKTMLQRREWMPRRRHLSELGDT